MKEQKMLIVGDNTNRLKLIDLLSEYLFEVVEQTPPEFTETIDRHFLDLAADTTPKPLPEYKTLYTYDDKYKKKQRIRRINKMFNKWR